VHVEGQTEEVFVNEVLRPHLTGYGYASVDARIVGNARLRSRRGGIRPWPSVRRDIVNHLNGDPGCVATMMVDYFRLPKAREAAWPGRAQASRKTSTPDKARTLERALAEDIAAVIPDRRRFIPFVTMHEFEGLLFSDCKVFCRAIGKPELTHRFQEIRDSFPTPEDINDSDETAPSKRVQALLPDYEKPLAGSIGVLEIGLPTIRSQCPHFDEWLRKLESPG
jgi:hypothetical protein